MKTKLRLLLNDLLYRRTHCTGTNVWYHKEEVDKTITEILSLVKECVPEEKMRNIPFKERCEFDPIDIANWSGWNAAIKQFLANIEGER